MRGKKKYNSLFSLFHPERIHQAQAAAAKARKALQQKPKPAAKPVSLLPSFHYRTTLWRKMTLLLSVFSVLCIMSLYLKAGAFYERLSLWFRSLEAKTEATKLPDFWKQVRI